jgi:hypothetical protein
MISQSAPRALEGSPSAKTGLAFIVTAVNKPDVLKAFLQPVTGLGKLASVLVSFNHQCCVHFGCQSLISSHSFPKSHGTFHPACASVEPICSLIHPLKPFYKPGIV